MAEGLNKVVGRKIEDVGIFGDGDKVVFYLDGGATFVVSVNLGDIRDPLTFSFKEGKEVRKNRIGI